MVLGLAVLMGGLVLLGIILAKTFGLSEDADKRLWYGVALLGVVISLTGLVLTLKALRETPEITAEVTVVKERPVESKNTEVDLEDYLTTVQPSSPAAPEKIVTSEKNIPRIAKRRREVLAKQLAEDPDGEVYNQEDYQYFKNQMNFIRKGYDQVIEETITGSPPPHKAEMPKSTLWANFEWNHFLWVNNLKRRATVKNGPGTKEVKKRIYAICKTYTKIEKVYHNGVKFKREIDYQYISDLENQIEKLYNEIEEIGRKNGIEVE